MAAACLSGGCGLVTPKEWDARNQGGDTDTDNLDTNADTDVGDTDDVETDEFDTDTSETVIIDVADMDGALSIEGDSYDFIGSYVGLLPEGESLGIIVGEPAVPLIEHAGTRTYAVDDLDEPKAVFDIGPKSTSVADIDGDGEPDIVIGGSVEQADCAMLFAGPLEGLSTRDDAWVLFEQPDPYVDYQGASVLLAEGIFGAGKEGGAALLGDIRSGPNDAGALHVFSWAMIAGMSQGSTLSLNEAEKVITGDGENGYFGRATALAGDYWGDGTPGIVASAPGEDAGTVYVFELPFPEGTVAAADLASAVLTGVNQPGMAIATGGDADGDGSNGDVLIGAPFGTPPGRIYVILGQTESGDMDALAPATIFGAGGDNPDGLGQALAFAELDGEPGSEIVAGAAYTDDVYVFSGSIEGKPDVTDALVRIIGSDYSELGFAVAAGDLFADGLDEVLVGAPKMSTTFILSAEDFGL